MNVVDSMWCYENPREAAAEIERLRAEVERLRAALASAAAAMGEVLTRPVPKSAPNLPPSHVHS